MENIKIDKSKLVDKYHFLSDPLTFSDKKRSNFCQPETNEEFLTCLMKTKKEFFNNLTEIQKACYLFSRAITKNRELRAFKARCKKIITLKEKQINEQLQQ